MLNSFECGNLERMKFGKNEDNKISSRCRRPKEKQNGQVIIKKTKLITSWVQRGHSSGMCVRMRRKWMLDKVKSVKDEIIDFKVLTSFLASTNFTINKETPYSGNACQARMYLSFASIGAKSLMFACASRMR